MTPKTRRDLLPNGLTTIAIHRPGAATAMVCVDVRVGPRYETAEDAGLSHFLEHMVFQGCAGHPTPEAVNEACERLGSALDASTTRDHTHYEHWVAADRLLESARLLSAVLRAPAFLSIESERAIILEEALDEFDEDGNRIDADTLSRRLLWPDVPLGQSIIGELSHLRRFDVDDLRRHHRAFYGARNMIATAVGPQSVDELAAILRDAFADLPPGVRHTPATPRAPLDGPVIELMRDHRSQCDCRLVIRTPGRHDPRQAAISMVRVALDDGLASRMHRRMGAELGLAYDQWAAWEHYPDTGAFEIGAQVSPGKVRTFFDEAVALLEGMVEAPPEGDELDRVRFRARWAVAGAYETSEGLVSLYGTPHLWWSDPPTPERALAELEAVTPDDMRRAARELLDPQNMVACCVGPLDKTTRRAIRARLHRLMPDT